METRSGWDGIGTEWCMLDSMALSGARFWRLSTWVLDSEGQKAVSGHALFENVELTYAVLNVSC
jgi:hypothetical protein